MRQLLAAWLVVDPQDLPMNPRLLGKPGVGKTTLAYAAAKRLGREVYIMQATVDTRPEDLLVTPVIEGEARLRYVASPLVTAMLRGGIVILDEGNRMSEKSWASLAPLLDNRRYVESIVAGVKIKAHPLFRLVATMNDDASTFDLPEYIHSRLQPQILIDFPERHEEFAILHENLPFGDDHILNYVTDFLQQAHAADERYTARDGINIARFAMKLGLESGHGGRRAKSCAPRSCRRSAKRPCAMSLEAEIKAGSLERGRFRYFPVVPGALEFAHRAAPPAARREAAASSRSNCRDFWPSTYRRALERLPEMSVILYTDEDRRRSRRSMFRSSRPIRSPRRCARPQEIGAEVIFLEPDSNERPHLPDTYPDTYAIRRIGLDRYIEAYRVWPQTRTEEVSAHASAMAWKLQGADPSASVVVVVSLNLLDPLLDAMESPQPPPAAAKQFDVRLLNPHPDCLAEITIEYPYLQERYEFFRLDLRRRGERLDRPRVQFDLLREAEAKYTESTGEKTGALAAAHDRALHAQSGAHERRSGGRTSTIWRWRRAPSSTTTTAGKSGRWRTAIWRSRRRSDLETVRLSAGEIWINTKRLRIRRRLPRPKQRLKPAGLKPRKREKFPGEWARQTTGDAICSYPPEDLVIEEYGRFLKTESQGDAVRRARPRGAVHHFDPGRHRHPRNHSQLASAQDLRAARRTGWRAKSARWW